MQCGQIELAKSGLQQFSKCNKSSSSEYRASKVATQTQGSRVLTEPLRMTCVARLWPGHSVGVCFAGSSRRPCIFITPAEPFSVSLESSPVVRALHLTSAVPRKPGPLVFQSRESAMNAYYRVSHCRSLCAGVARSRAAAPVPYASHHSHADVARSAGTRRCSLAQLTREVSFMNIP